MEDRLIIVTPFYGLFFFVLLEVAYWNLQWIFSNELNFRINPPKFLRGKDAQHQNEETVMGTCRS